MDTASQRWRQVAPSQHAWEAEAMERLRASLAGADPFYAWTYSEFTDGGRMEEGIVGALRRCDSGLVSLAQHTALKPGGCAPWAN